MDINWFGIVEIILSQKSKKNGCSKLRSDFLEYKRIVNFNSYRSKNKKITRCIHGIEYW